MLSIHPSIRPDDRSRAVRRVVAWRRAVQALGGSDPAAVSGVVPALVDFCETLEAAALWDRIHQLNPLAGGSAQAHAASLAGPHFTMSGTLTHDASGVSGDGSTGYINTGATLAGINAGSTAATGFAIGMNDPGPVVSDYPMGVLDNGTSEDYVRIGIDSGGGAGNTTWRTADPSEVLTIANASRPGGLMGIQVEADGSAAIYRDDASLATASLTPTGEVPASDMYLLARNAGGANSHSAYTVWFWALTRGLSSGEWAGLRAAVSQLQADLGR